MAKKVSQSLKLTRIKLLLLDVDGVMTDAGVYYGKSGEELKKFNIQDGYGIVKLKSAGVHVGIITGRVSEIVKRRAEELGIQEVHQNLNDKLDAYERIKEKMHLQDDEIAYVGDDEPDVPVLQKVGFSAMPADGVDSVRKSVAYVCKRRGGEGAVREVIELILKAKSNGRA